MANENLIFFLHIPKNSGTTLNHIIRKNYSMIYKVSWNHFLPNHASNILKSKNPNQFDGIEVVSGHFPYGLHKVVGSGSKFQYLTMLREPIKRSLSAFNYLRNDSQYIKSHPELKKYINCLSLSEFYSTLHECIPNHIYTDNCQVRYISGIGENKAFGMINKEDLEIAKRNLEKIFFGLTEEFNRSMLYFQMTIGWQQVKYIRQKIGSKKGYLSSDEDRSALEKCNLFDKKLYEYAVNLFRIKTVKVTEKQLDDYEKSLYRYRVTEKIKNWPRSLIHRFRNRLVG